MLLASSRRLASALGLFLPIAIAGCSGSPGSSAGASGGGANSNSATIAQTYEQKCRFCHGPDGAGGGAPALTAAAGKPAAELRKVIEDGGKKMPAFKKQLTQEQIDAMVEHVQGFGKG
ncbi:MAG: c-type cytochrome [Actinomycetota bacterium]